MSNFFLAVHALLPVLLAIGALVLLALVLDAHSTDGKW